MCLVSIPYRPEDRLFYTKKTSRSHVEIFSRHPFGTKCVRNKNPSKEFNRVLLGEKKILTTIGVLRSGSLLGSEDLMSSHLL